MLKLRISSLLTCVVLCASLAQAKQLAIVADKENATGNVKVADLANILNGKTKNWIDGKAIKVILRDPSSRDMEIVFRRVLNMTPEQVRALMQAHPGLIVVADSDEQTAIDAERQRAAVART